MNKKKSIALLLGLIMSVSAVTAGAATALADQSGWEYDGDTKTLTIKSDTEDFTAETYETVPWNDYKDKTESIVVENGVTKIGDFAFCFEQELTNVTLPDTLTSIGTAAFAGSDTLKAITIPSNVTTIGDNAFGYNSQMNLTDGFVAKCDVNSYAQSYCLQNYIMFDSPVAVGESNAVIENGNAQSIWSFAPKTNCTVTFASSSSDDTFGLIYDAQTYTYSDNFSTMKKSAITSNDDGDGKDDSNLNFSIEYNLTAGKRYYLSAKYKNPIDTGSFKINFAFECTEHIYTEEIIEQPSCEKDGYSVFTCIGCGKSYTNKLYALGHSYEVKSFDGDNVTIGCANCENEYSISFMDYYNKSNSYLDVVEDGTVNAKDYAKLVKEYKNK
ncbi:MAG: leucine-rich repeat domain-containing protein [Clostridia bacterium]|nr:leucine-rich repeat domain-containing protein [Clostridia bacterium]